MRWQGFVISLATHLFLLSVIIFIQSRYTVPERFLPGDGDGRGGDGVVSVHYVGIAGAEGGGVGETAEMGSENASDKSGKSIDKTDADPGKQKLPTAPATSAPDNDQKKNAEVRTEKDVADGKVRENGSSESSSGGASSGNSSGGASSGSAGSSGSGGSLGGSGGHSGGGIGTGSNAGAGGFNGSYYPAVLNDVFLPPLPAPKRVKGFTMVAIFVVDTLGQARVIRFKQTPDAKYNRELRSVLESLKFKPARSAEGRLRPDTAAVVFQF